MGNGIPTRGAWIAVFVCSVMVVATPLGLPGVALADQSVETAACLDCHDDMAATLKSTSHDPSVSSKVKVGCSSCHSGWQKHMDDPSVENIVNPSTASVADVLNTCRQCHTPHAEKETVGLDPHFNQERPCTDCHQAHAGQEHLRPENPATLCAKCHVGIAETFARRSNHPVSDGIVTCTSCHSFLGGGEPTVGYGATANCYSCHPEQSGPFLYEHPVALSFAVEGEGCTECHAPHGSGNERLLTRKGSALCKQCHGIPPGHTIEHSGLGSKLECVECHSEIHGSNHNSKMLDPDLGTKLFPDCYQSGCHIVNP